MRSLPYGRNNNRSELALVYREKGTCSSKHALLKKLADLNNIPDVKLILAIYKMNQSNTPGIGRELTDNGIDYIPEAHCYLKIKCKRIDLTSKQSDIDKIELDIIKELEILPYQTGVFKVNYHKDFLKMWITGNNLLLDFDQLWKVRENCIKKLGE